MDKEIRKVNYSPTQLKGFVALAFVTNSIVVIFLE